MIKEIKQEDFEKETQEWFVLLDVYGTNCGPCHMLSGILEELDFDFPFINILKLCSDESREFCKKHRIMSVPTMFFIKDGEIKEKVIGTKTKEELIEIAGKYMY